MATKSEAIEGQRKVLQREALLLHTWLLVLLLIVAVAPNPAIAFDCHFCDGAAKITDDLQSDADLPLLRDGQCVDTPMAGMKADYRDCRWSNGDLTLQSSYSDAAGALTFNLNQSNVTAGSTAMFYDVMEKILAKVRARGGPIIALLDGDQITRSLRDRTQSYRRVDGFCAIAAGVHDGKMFFLLTAPTKK